MDGCQGRQRTCPSRERGIRGGDRYLTFGPCDPPCGRACRVNAAGDHGVGAFLFVATVQGPGKGMEDEEDYGASDGADDDPLFVGVVVG